MEIDQFLHNKVYEGMPLDTHFWVILSKVNLGILVQHDVNLTFTLLSLSLMMEISSIRLSYKELTLCWCGKKSQAKKGKQSNNESQLNLL